MSSKGKEIYIVRLRFLHLGIFSYFSNTFLFWFDISKLKLIQDDEHFEKWHPLHPLHEVTFRNVTSFT